MSPDNATRVGFLATLLNGFPFASDRFTGSPSAGMPLVRIRDVMASEFTTFIPAEDVPDAVLVRGGDLVIGMDGDFNVRLWDRGPAALNQRVCLLRPLGETDMRFIAYVLPVELQRLNELAYATTVKHLSSGDVLGIPVPNWAPDVQRSIADYLDHEAAEMDAMSARLDDLITALNLRRQSVVDGAFVVPAGEGDEGGAWSEWWGWTWPGYGFAPLGLLGDLRSGVTLGKESSPESEIVELPYLRVANVQDGRLNLSELKTVRVPLADAEKYQVPDHSVLLTEGGDLDKLGRGAVWNSEITPCLHQNHIFAFVCGERLDPFYLSYVTSASASRAYFMLTGTQATNLATTNSAKVKRLPIPLPPLDEQRRIVTRLDEETAMIDAMIADARELKNLIAERRSALITEVVTGRKEI